MELTLENAVNMTIYCRSFENVNFLLEAQNGYIYLYNLVVIVENINEKEYLKICEANSYLDYFCQALKDLAPIVSFLDIKNPKHIHFYSTPKDLNEKQIYSLHLILKIINRLLPISHNFRSILTEQDGLGSLLNILNQQNFIQDLHDFNPNILMSLIFDINWLSRSADIYKNTWYDLKAVDIISNYIKKYDHVKLFALMALSNIASDKDIENISEFDMAIDLLTEMTIKCANDCDRMTTQEYLDELDNTIYYYEIKSFLDQKINATISLTGILLILYKISINNKRKIEIFKKPGLMDSLYKLIYEGNDFEKQNSLELVTQLCFDTTIFEEIRKNTQLFEFVSNLSKAENIKFKKLYRTCEQFLWKFKQDAKVESQLEQSQSLSRHVMISYNSASRDLCLKIKKYLENINYKVWIDIDEIHGSSLDSMAKAVEDAQVILMCVTEKYRQSLNCQSEAQYAFRLNKPIIPCIMQKGYGSVTGWLGFIIGDKIFVDFTKYELDESLNKLLDQISRLDKNSKKDSIPLTLASKVAESSVKITEDSVLNWDEIKVEKWFVDNSFNDILNKLKPLNGKNLHQLYQLQLYTPEFFYKSLTVNEMVNVRQLVLFITALKDLFEMKEK
ncbi:unnamed protein product [Brachionus calyciflorus]|uniref:TIR domain-containing protein n=1 Tax=Brachionus calyciflorus TaxID=104777 RepID=A0A813XZL7_9BILA|nr:unnamed protein product [Brachionus calyciflorus]